jgi:fructose/tagatose bisphosphate aldolase
MEGVSMIFKDTDGFLNRVKEAVSISKEGVKVIDENLFREKIIDELIYNLLFHESAEIRNDCSWLIRECSHSFGIYPASIQSFYEARGREEVKDVTVPAINLRGLTYDSARALIRTAVNNQSLAFIFEIARSEIRYTLQSPQEYASVCMGAAIKEGFKGPLFIQGDHFQVNPNRYLQEPEREIEELKSLIREAIDASFYNIDIDSSTLVDLSKPTIREQQKVNFEVAASLTAFIRGIEPRGITISIGAEIGEVGGKNSTEEELYTFMDGYLKTLSNFGDNLKGISKISVQTGTTHGGVVLADGSIAKVKLDFDTLKRLSYVARKNYGLSGCVQHGASTLPDEAFHKFPDSETAEVHLATGFQNIIYESEFFPSDLRERMYLWLREKYKDEWKEGQTEEQFIYKTRKKAFGPFKKELMDLPQSLRDALRKKLEEKFDFLFKKLNANNTKDLLIQYISPVRVTFPIPSELLSYLSD